MPIYFSFLHISHFLPLLYRLISVTALEQALPSLTQIIEKIYDKLFPPTHLLLSC